MIIVRKDDGETFIPPGHEGMEARKLYGPENGSDKAAFHLSTLSPGGGMTEEVHDGSDQIFYVLSGKITAVTDGKEIGLLEAGDGIHVAAGDSHAFRNTGDEPCRLIVVTVPPIVP